MDKEQIHKIIEFLEHFRKSRRMYFENPDEIENVRSFLHGFNIAYMLTTGKQVPRFDPEGWEASYHKVPYPKPDRNIDDLSAKDLVEQTIEIQINAWKKLLETTK